ncbi:uncharacterized protein EI90DRAFT_3288897 [Cantharellus anzutake]|uniref:uncharacterized protein n=1 Tax=Cantharellus anzutake TaxID=1750568 RepID=UPI001907C36F|nr:uncharacterized protein EI90DRAFT_3288897 [Cantharellus anzutake]KAF8332692.1 hypothetical protein EI90DRAFT_3288897 [Cantharellus anzutake]
MSSDNSSEPGGPLGEMPVQVVLASHSYSFSIANLPPNATISELKHAIFEQCPGRPKQSGQRVIFYGRVLGDNETLPDSNTRTIHLAVHPSAWTATPPPSPKRPSAVLPGTSSSVVFPSVASPAPAPPSTEPPLPLSLQLSSLPTEFITHMHANALRILSGQPAISWPGPSELAHARRVTRTVIKYAGLGWASALEQDLPTDIVPTAGLQYTTVIVDNLPFLALSSPDVTPTAEQALSLRILTYTFPLLPLLKHLPRPSPASSRRTTLASGPPNQNQIIRRFGINVRVQRGARAPQAPEILEDRVIIDDENPQAYFPPVPEFRFQFNFQIPPSRVLLQLLFTLSRAALLVYFFEAARKPLWLACIVGWIGWEIYVVLRHTGRERDARGAVQGGAAQNAALERNGAMPAGGEGQAQAGGGAGQGNVGPPAAAITTPGVTNISRYIDRIANINLANESLALRLAVRAPTPRSPAVPGDRPSGSTSPPREQEVPESPAGSSTELADHLAAVEPSLVHRMMTFLALFSVSLFPVIWDRRRARFREREAWVREMFEAGRPDPDALVVEGRPPPPSGTEEGRRRRDALIGWRKAYVDRVIDGEIGEDVEF